MLFVPPSNREYTTATNMPEHAHAFISSTLPRDERVDHASLQFDCSQTSSTSSESTSHSLNAIGISIRSGLFKEF